MGKVMGTIAAGALCAVWVAASVVAESQRQQKETTLPNQVEVAFLMSSAKNLPVQASIPLY